jgi:hypothetical protein
VGGFLTRLIVTYAYIGFSNRSSMPYDTPSQLLECSPTTSYEVHSFGTILDARLSSTPDRSTSELLRTL